MDKATNFYRYGGLMFKISKVPPKARNYTSQQEM